MLLEYNLSDLSAKLEKAQFDLHKYKGDEAIELLKLSIDTAKNIQILEIQRLKSSKEFTKDFAYHLGRLEALSDLGHFIENAFDEDRFEHLRGRKIENPKKRILKKTYGTVGPVI